VTPTAPVSVATSQHPSVRSASSFANAWNLLLLAAFLVGLALRLWQLDIQILIDDEWHAIHKLLRAGPLDILTHFGYADYSIPLTLYYQWLYEHGGLSEWGMHLPPLLGSIGLLLIGPRLLRPAIALPTLATWTLLVAISPLFVYHAKVARPYGLTCVLTFVAIVAFRAWWLGRQRRDAVLCALSTVFAAWLHPVTLPFTLLPFVYYGAQSLRPWDAAAVARLVRLGLATAALLALFLLPPLIADGSTLAERAARHRVTAGSVWRTLLMLFGTGSSVAGACMLCVAGLGFYRLARRDPELAWYLATIVGIGSVAVAASGAEWIDHPLVLARYMLPALPFMLLLEAEGIMVAIERLPAPRASAAACAVLVAVLLYIGPIPREWSFPNQFWGHLRYQFDYDPAENPYARQEPTEHIPAFYRDLAQRPPGSVTLIEAPWRFESHFNAQALYQTIHRQLIRIGLTASMCGNPESGEYVESRTGMRMRQFVQLSSVLSGDVRDADYLVIHLKPGHVVADPGVAWPDIRSCLPAIEAKMGAPVYDDEWIRVFALPRLR
jgi:hypothetical protein